MNTTEQAPKQDMYDQRTSRLAHKIRAAVSQWCMFCMQCADGTEERVLAAFKDPTGENAQNAIRYAHGAEAIMGVLFAKHLVKAIDREAPDREGLDGPRPVPSPSGHAPPGRGNRLCGDSDGSGRVPRSAHPRGLLLMGSEGFAEWAWRTTHKAQSSIDHGLAIMTHRLAMRAAVKYQEKRERISQ